MRPALCALVVLAVLAGACSGDNEPEAAADPTSTPEPTPSVTAVEPTPTPEPTEEAVAEELAPLTGMPVAEGEDMARPVVALKIDNARAARPPSGLELADIVLEELVEGGVTRFIALYHSVDPGPTGPVRSGREVDAELMPAFTPVFGISGAAGVVHQDLRAAGLTVFEEGQGGGAFYRQAGRRAPHNLFATPERLWAAGADLPDAEVPWAIEDAIPTGGETAEQVRLRFSSAAHSVWTWDGDVWRRAQDGAAHIAESGAQVGARNVIVARVVTGPGGRTDAGGNPTVDIEVVGEGEALVMRDGYVYPAKWRKASANDQFEWLTPEGDPLALAPGNTWIELVPVSGSVTIDDEPAG